MSFIKCANQEFKYQNYVKAYYLYIEAKDKYGFDFLDFNIEMCRKLIGDDKLLFKPIYTSTLSSGNRTVDIIIPIYNALEDVKNCINSLYKYKSYDFNLIVIDDCSDKKTENYLKEEAKKKNFKLLRNKENLRFTKTVNRGFKESKGDFVVLLNSDTIVTPKWIEKILACFESDDKIGIVGPLSNAASWQTVPVRDDKEFGGWLVNEIPKGYSVEEMGMLVETISKKLYPKVPSVNGFCYVIKREVLETNGALDEEYFPTGYGEEDDFSIRAIDAGFKIAVADDTYIFHAKSKSYTHETRAILSVKGRKALDAKHGIARLKKLVSDWKAEPTLPSIAKNIESYMQIATKNKKVVYTAIFGDYDSIKEPEYVNEDWDYICFTNNKNLKSDIFTIKYVDSVFGNQTKNARMIKILSHIFLIGYDYSLWIDGSVKLRGRNINELIDKHLKKNYLALHKHIKRDCLYIEGKECILQKKDISENISRQIECYKKEGMPQSFSLYETAELLRCHAQDRLKELNLMWWKELNSNTIRDQISLPYVIWKHKFSVNIMENSQWLDAYFKMYSHNMNFNQISNEPSVSIIMLVKDQIELTRVAITSLFDNTEYKNFELIIVDNDSNEETKLFLQEMNKKFHQITVITNKKNESFSKANNQAARFAKGDFLCLINNDLEFNDSKWLTNLVSKLENTPNAAAVGPILIYPNFKIQSASIRIKIKGRDFIGAEENRMFITGREVAGVTGACMLLKKELYLKVGGLDERYWYGQEDVDLNLKLLENRYKILLCSNSEVIHHESATRKANETTILNRKKIKSKWANRVHFHIPILYKGDKQ